MKIIHGSYAEEQRTNGAKTNATAANAPTPTDYKSCPICGAVCFADMDVCFGCLHQFDAKDAANSNQQNIRSASSSTPNPASVSSPSSPLATSVPHDEPQESYSEEELAALLEQMRSNFAFPVQETAPAQQNKPVETPVALEPATQTAGSGHDGNDMTTRHICEGKDGQRFEITISIKLL